MPGARHPDRGSRTAACALAVVLALGATGCGRLDRDAVDSELKELGSAASEGALLAHEAGRKRTYESFVQIHSAELHKVAFNVNDTLDSTPTEDDLQKVADRASDLAQRIAGLLERLHARAGDASTARTVERELQRLSDRVDKLESEL